MTATTTPRRDWTKIGAPFAELRPKIEQAIAELVWTEPIPGRLPMVPGLAIEAVIDQLPLPMVTGCAINGCVEGHDGTEGFSYAVYGIQATGYKNIEKLRLIVLDTGTSITPVCSDVYA